MTAPGRLRRSFRQQESSWVGRQLPPTFLSFTGSDRPVETGCTFTQELPAPNGGCQGTLKARSAAELLELQPEQMFAGRTVHRRRTVSFEFPGV